jgi:hypothetical protein
MFGRWELGELFRGHSYFRVGLVDDRWRLPRLEVWGMRYARRPLLRCRCVRGWRATREDLELEVRVGRTFGFPFRGYKYITAHGSARCKDKTEIKNDGVPAGFLFLGEEASGLPNALSYTEPQDLK